MSKSERPPSDHLDDHWTLEATKDRVLWCRRKNCPYTTPAQAEAILSALEQRVRAYPHATWAIMYDARSAPLPNPDPAMEAVMLKARRRIFEGFAGAAILVRTAAGSMQASRQAKEDGGTYGVFNDEKAALEYLAKCLVGKRRTTLV